VEVNMNLITKRLLFWTPRALCIAFVLFTSIFALDVFSERLPWWRVIIALAIHLVPTALLALVTFIAWRTPWLGTLFFIAFGAIYIIGFYGRFHLSVYFAIAGPPFLIGLLFLANWIWRDELNERNSLKESSL
jgi:hypothetical protein